MILKVAMIVALLDWLRNRKRRRRKSRWEKMEGHLKLMRWTERLWLMRNLAYPRPGRRGCQKNLILNSNMI
jgi:hypothetical protein